jgi:trans-2,3-dihydro-3-hydroxyanthranilate isomerase
VAQQKRQLPFVQVDVFTSEPLVGNPLAVFTDGRGLSDGEMQGLAREMNLSETTFVLPRDAAVERERGTRVRIFTVREELPFAGHPTLGTAFVLRGTTGLPEIALDLAVGRVGVRFQASEATAAFGEMTQAEPSFGRVHDRVAVAAAAGLDPSELDPDLPVETVSTGLPFTIMPLRSLDTLRALRVDLDRVASYFADGPVKAFYFVTRDTRDPAVRLRARMLFYGGEDPATGSAAGCAAAFMVAHGVARPEERVLIEQGAEALRPSRIFVRAARTGAAVTNVRVGGEVVEVLRGEVSL